MHDIADYVALNLVQVKNVTTYDIDCSKTLC